MTVKIKHNKALVLYKALAYDPCSWKFVALAHADFANASGYSIEPYNIDLPLVKY